MGERTQQGRSDEQQRRARERLKEKYRRLGDRITKREPFTMSTANPNNILEAKDDNEREAAKVVALMDFAQGLGEVLNCLGLAIDEAVLDLVISMEEMDERLDSLTQALDRASKQSTTVAKQVRNLTLPVAIAATLSAVATILIAVKTWYG